MDLDRARQDQMSSKPLGVPVCGRGAGLHTGLNTKKLRRSSNQAGVFMVWSVLHTPAQ